MACKGPGVVVLDFGSVYISAIVERLRQARVEVFTCEGSSVGVELSSFRIRAVVFAGGPRSILSKEIPGLPSCVCRTWHV